MFFRDEVFLLFCLWLFILILNFSISKRVYPGKGGWGVREGLGTDQVMVFYISPHLMLSIMFFSFMHFHNHLFISISPKILKETFAKGFTKFTSLWFCVTLGHLRSSNTKKEVTKAQLFPSNLVFNHNSLALYLYLLSYFKMTFFPFLVQ